MFMGIAKNRGPVLSFMSSKHDFRGARQPPHFKSYRSQRKEYDMRRILPLILVSAFIAPLGVSAQGFAIAGQAGTMGVGGSVILGVAPKVNFRGTFGYIPGDVTLNVDNIDFGLEFPTFMRATVDLYPMGGFHISAGGIFISDGGNFTVNGTFNGTQDFGGNTYTGAEVGTLTGTFNLKSAMPYLGIGFGNPVGGLIGINLDLGVGIGNKPGVELSASGLIANDPTFINDLNTREQDLANDIPDFLKYYPVISLSLSIGIGG
jgi:hypothetical protein